MHRGVLHPERPGANDGNSWLFGACNQRHPCFPVNTRHFSIALLFLTPNSFVSSVSGPAVSPSPPFWDARSRFSRAGDAGWERIPAGHSAGDAAGHAATGKRTGSSSGVQSVLGAARSYEPAPLSPGEEHASGR